MNRLLTLIAAASTASSAMAVTVNVSDSSGPTSLSPVGIFNLTVPQVDLSAYPGYFIASIEYSLTVTSYATYNILGTSPSPQGSPVNQYTANWTTFPEITSLPHVGVAPVLASFNGSESGIIGPAMGTTANAVGMYGPFGVPGSEFSVYEGVGTVSFQVTIEATSGIQGPASNEVQPAVFASVDLDVVYTLDIPEPSTYAAVGFLALAGGAAAYRRRKAQA
jgi:hypothetical protein